MNRWFNLVILFAGLALIPAISAHALLPQPPVQTIEDTLDDISV